MGTWMYFISAQILLLLFSETSCVPICAKSGSSPFPPSSVHSLRPGDIALVSALGLSTTYRSEILHRLSEMLSTYNPALTTLLPKQGTLLEEAEYLVASLKNDQWKLLLLFVPVDELCVCNSQVRSAVDSAVHKVEEALDKLHEKLDHALVHVMVWGGFHPLDSACKCQHEEISSPHTQNWPRLERATLMTVLQESLDALLSRRGWWSDREDFSVMLMSSPTIQSSSKIGKVTDSAETFNQLWKKLSSCYLATYKNSKSAAKITQRSLPSNWGSDFSCSDTKPSDTIPTSVHRLRPGDINVVASLGDSITAGFGAKAKNILELMNEERGVSWSIGGDETLETVTTVPNIIKKFNPNVFGFSKGQSKRPNGFNMAVSGAKASHIPGQVRDLIEALRNSSSVDFEQDWKLVTLFIGGNDLCEYCQDQVSLSPKRYIEHIKEALDILYNEVPRVLVNFVEILQIEDLRKVKANTIGCALQSTLCPCFLNPEENSDELFEMKRINREMQTETERLVYGGRYDKRGDFALVLQPFFQNSVLPMGADRTPDLSYFSVDCFHFTERGHAEMAIALWNNMLEPVGSKRTYNNFTYDRTKISCPSEDHPFIFTRVNSFTTGPTELASTTSVVVSVTPDNNRDSVPSWSAALLAVTGLLIGVVVTWTIMHCRKKRKSPNLSPLEMNPRGVFLVSGKKLDSNTLYTS